jgi:thiamine biosynthesis protein ThiI
VIVRFSGEIGIKAEWTRRTYEKLVLSNVYSALKHHGVAYDKLTRKRGRIYVKSDNASEVAERLTRVFGISSVSPAAGTTSDMDGIAKAAVVAASETVARGGSFAVRCHRVGEHAYSSLDVCRHVGEQILSKLEKKKLHVDLTNPQVTVNIEVREAEAYVFAETLKGAGGFPVGAQAKVVGLLSGGIDSPVALWLAMKRGCTVTPIYLDNAPLTDETTTEKALETARKLFEWSIGYPRKVYVVPHGTNLQTIMEKAPRRFTCLLCKRMMYRIAERIADVEKAEGIVTGEAIGEQASQTLINLRVLNEAARSYPVHRPLLGFDKTETEALARRIGTFETSIRAAKGCTAAPNQPSTQARLEAVKEAEAKLDIQGLADESIKAAKIVTV